MKSNEPTEIPYWIYLIVGTVVLIVSYFVNRAIEDNKMTLFLIIGGVFLLVGIVKLIIPKPKPKKQAHHRSQQQVRSQEHPGHQQTYKSQLNPQRNVHSNVQIKGNAGHPRHNPVHHAVRCPKCNAKLHPRFRYCPGCGARV